MNANEQHTMPSEAANSSANKYAENGDTLRVRLGVQPRTFQKVWKKTFGYSFDSRKIVTESEVQVMEAKYLLSKKNDVKTLRQKRRPVEIKAEVLPEAREIKAEISVSKITTESIAAWAMFLVPTIASIRNTVSVSGAFSGSHETALLITATISGTGILWIMSRKKVGWGDLAGILFFQIFEAFSNTVQIFKNLMGSMAYGISTVTGQPSDFLDMVATTTQSDHRQTAILLAVSVSLFILAAQIKGLLLIKYLKK